MKDTSPDLAPSHSSRVKPSMAFTTRVPTTILVVHHPAGFDQFLDEMQKLSARHGSQEERARLAARFDMIAVPTEI
jgi:hypothetical protein